MKTWSGKNQTVLDPTKTKAMLVTGTARVQLKVYIDGE